MATETGELALSRRLLPRSPQRHLGLLVGIAGFLALLLSACAPGEPVALRVGSGCYSSGTEGDLVADADAGTAIVEASGRRYAVIWPRGFTGP